MNNAELLNRVKEKAKTEEYTKDDTAYREFMVKLRKIKDKMLTQAGKRIAEERHRFVLEFFDRLDKEFNGNT